MDYRLTISDIKKNLDELRAEGLPLFRFVENIEQTCFSLEDFRDSELCPVEEISTFEADLESHFSRDEDTVCISMTNPNLLYFLMGGNRRIVSDNTYLSRLVNASPSSSKFYDLIISDLVNWKLSTGEDGKQQFMDCRKTGVPVGAVSMIDYIVQENEHIISRFCSHKSQEALRKLLRDYALNICGMESTEPDWAASLKSVPARPLIIMDMVHVKKLANFLDLSTSMAEVSQECGEQPKYLAQGLTWLLIAALLRGKLSSMQGELDRAISCIYRDANEIGKDKTENLDGNITTYKSEFEKTLMAEPGSPAESLYEKLKNQLEYEQKTHSSFILMNEAAGLDRSLFPKGSLQLRSGDRQAELDEETDSNIDKAPKTASLSEYIRESWMPRRPRHITIEGEGGIGKTVALLSLATEPGGFPEQAPTVYIPLHRLNLVRIDEKSKNDASSLLDAYIDSYLKKCGCTESELNAFSALCNNDKDGLPQIILLLDGYNEVLDDLKRQVRLAINEWAVKPGVQIITTSRTAWSCGDDFMMIRLQPLTEDDIRSYLERTGAKIPALGDNLWRVINYPLMLTLYAHIEAVQKRVISRLSPEILNKEDLVWHPMNRAGNIIWNYLQKELARCAEDMGDRNNLSIEDHAVAILHTAPFIAWRMSREDLFSLPLAEDDEPDNRETLSFSGLVRESLIYLKDLKNWSDQLRKIIIKNDRTGRKKREWVRLAENRDSDKTFSKVERIVQLLLDEINLFRIQEVKESNTDSSDEKSESRVQMMHQQFRDGLAAIWLCQRIESMESADRTEDDIFKSTGDKYALPLCWREKIGRYVLKFAAEIMDNEAAEKFWEAGRVYQPSDVKFAYTMLNLMSERSVKDGLYQNDFSSLNFKGMDLRDISLFYFKTESSNKLQLPCLSTPGSTPETMVSINTFMSPGHSGCIMSVAVTADGKRAVSGGEDGSIRIWDLESMRYEMELPGHSGCINSVAVTADGKRAVSSGDDGIIRIWDLESMRCEMELPGYSRRINSVAVATDGKWFASGDHFGIVRIWDLESMRCEMELHGNRSEINSVAVTADGKRAVSGGDDGTIRIWDLDSIRCEKKLSRHSKHINSDVVPEDCRPTVNGSDDGTIRIWDFDELCCGKVLSGHRGNVRIVSVTADGKRAVSGGDDGALRIWDLDNMCLEKELFGHSGWIRSIAITADGKHSVSGGEDGTIRIWNLESMRCERALPGHSRHITSVAVIADGKRAVSGGDDGTIRIWNLESMHCERALFGHNRHITSVAVLANGKQAISGGQDGTIRIWNLESMHCEKALPGHRDSIRIAVAANGKRAVSSDSDGVLRIWDLDDMCCKKELSGHRDISYSIAVTSDGKHAISGGDDGTIRIWDLDNMCLEKELFGHSGWISSIAITADGKHAVSGGYDKTIRIWDLDVMRCEMELSGHRVPIYSVAVSADGKRAVSSDRDGVLRIWDLDDMCCEMELRSDSIGSVAVTADGKRAVSGSYHGPVCVWNLDSMYCEMELPTHSCITSVAVTADGKRAVSGGDDGTIHIWDLDVMRCEKVLQPLPGIDIVGIDLSNAIISSDEDKEILRQNGAIVC